MWLVWDDQLAIHILARLIHNGRNVIYGHARISLLCVKSGRKLPAVCMHLRSSHVLNTKESCTLPESKPRL